MPRYAILGATGATGQQILQQLLSKPETQVNVYVRSNSKLLRLLPQIANNDKVRVFEGSMNDTSLLKDCIASTKAVFAVLATNDNAPGQSIAQDSATSILAAVDKLRGGSRKTKLPRIVVLSAVTVNKRLSETVPWAMHEFIYYALWHLYRDLEKAEELYLRDSQVHGSDLDVRFVQPGAIVEGEQSGVVTVSDVNHSDVVSYGDLAVGMIQVADGVDDERKNVSIVVKDGKKLNVSPMLILVLLQSLLWTFFPGLYRVAKYFHLK